MKRPKRGVGQCVPTSVLLSTVEEEWYAESEAGMEIGYVSSILNVFGFEQVSPTLLYEDSRAYLLQHLRRLCKYVM